MTPETRTQWIIAAFFAALLVFAVVIESRCTRQDGDASPAQSSSALVAGPRLGAHSAGHGHMHLGIEGIRTLRQA